MESTAIINSIDGTDLLLWFHSGAQEVYRNKRYLNSINVFPVPDGDTGTNLSTTMNAMVEIPFPDRTFSGIMRKMSESGLAHARGNSGILFASYINGLASESSAYDAVTMKEFSKIAYEAVRYLYQAIENPLEGTMISVIRDWASFLIENHSKYDNFFDLLTAAYQTATSSLKNTATQLDILIKYNLVDSGADGFVKFLNGINQSFKENDLALEINEIWHPDVSIEIDHSLSKYRYCTEVYLNATSIDINTPILQVENEIKNKLKSFGDSLIVSSYGRNIRVHIHADMPELVVQLVKPYGTLLEQKADDMYLQNSVRNNRLSNIGIITDSIADIPDVFKLDNQIHTLPLGLLYDDAIYLDKLTIKPVQLFELIKNTTAYPTSSQPEPGRVRAFSESLLDIYDSLIFIAVSSKMSGTYQTIVRECNNIKTEKKISIIDSRLNSGAQGLLVEAAAQLRQDGLSHDAIVTSIQEQISKTKIYVCLNTLEYAVRSGRVPDTIGHIGMRLGLRPIMTIDKDGNGAAFGLGFSKKSITKQIIYILNRTLKKCKIKAYSIVHADNEELALEYKNLLTPLLGKEPKFICEISSIVAIHSGLGSVAVCFTEE